ncbi:MAG: DUF6151 family protein [Steroidobacteraceae bacterium]
MQHPLQCQCGTIKGWVSDTQSANRVVCYCKGMVRWYAGCCKTPIGSTLENYKISFVGLLRNCLEAPGHSLQESFGAVRTHANPQGALGDPKPKAAGMFTTIWRFAKTILKARVNGDYKCTPFFKDARPIANPCVLSSAERASAMQSQAR